jgi:hypothetical protein
MQTLTGTIFQEKYLTISEEIHEITLGPLCAFCHPRDQIMKVIEVMNKF